MGVCCVKKQQPGAFTFQQSSLNIANGRCFPSLMLHFSLQRPSKLKAQCAMVFLNVAVDTDDCKMFSELRSPQLKTINQTIKGLAEKKPFVVGEFILVENPVNKLKVQYVLAVCLPVWKGGSANKQIDDAMRKAFKEVERLALKSLIICQPNDSLGLPNNVAAKILMNVLNDIQGGLEQVTFLLATEASQSYYHKLASSFPENRDLSSVHSDY